MSGLTSAMNTALSGLQAYEAGISTVSQNLANQATPGYAVETVNVTAVPGAPGQPGAGVQHEVTRAGDNFAAGRLRTANAASAAAGTQAGVLTLLSSALQNNGNVQASQNQFFIDMSTLSANPSSSGQAATVLSDAQTVAGSFQSAASSIVTVQVGTDTSLQQGVGTVNNLLGQLAAINQGLAQTPNSPALLDQQQAALNSLSGLLPVTVLPQSNGQVLIATGGTVLLDQSGVQPLTLTGGTNGVAPAITAGPANTPVPLTATDGSLGASLATWQSGAQALQGLNSQAAVFAASINTAQAQGLTPAGQPGGALFSVPPPSVSAAATNTGTATLTAQLTNAAQLPADGGPFVLNYAGAAGWNATDQASGQQYALGAGPALSFAGLSVNVSGAASSGDQFTINPAPGAASGIVVVANNPNQIATADPYVGTPGTLQSDGSMANNNAGTILTGTDTVTTTPAAGAAVIPASYYGQTLQVSFTSPTGYTVATAASPGTVIASGSFTGGAGNIAIAYPPGAASGQYVQLPISGTPATGDTVTLSPGGPNSGSNASRMAGLWTQPGTTSSGSLQQSIVNFGTALGANAQQAQQLSIATAAAVTTAIGNLQTASGVSLDQQAVTLTNYQQAYQAAAQVISVSNQMFQSLLQAV